MKTEAVISMLAAGAAPAPRKTLEQQFALAMLVGFSAAALVVVMGYGVRTDLVEALTLPMGWLKFGFTASLSALGAFAVLRLARPGMRIRLALVRTAAPLLILWIVAFWVLQGAAPAARMDLVMGNTWRSCPFSIAMLSIPGLLALLWAMRQAAPTRLRLAGAGAGLLSGALAATAYALHCPEMEAPFLAVWYLLGIAIPTLLGAAVGPRVLRW